MAHQPVIHLRVDVDFNEGLRRGVPFLLDLLEKHGLKATFYVVMGPDTLYRHSRRVRSPAFRRRLISLNFLKILRHLGPAYLKSWLGSPRVAAGHPWILQEILRRGHELGVHGFNHAEWADRCYRMSPRETFLHMERAFSTFRSLLGRDPATWGAPNWRVNDHMFRFLEEAGISYSSDTRGISPFYPLAGGKVFRVLQLPITLPCLHELVGQGIPRREVPGILESCLGRGYNLLCIHDYYEGILERDLFAATLERLVRRGWSFRPLGEKARKLVGAPVPPGGIGRVWVPGGARPVSCQDSFPEKNYFSLLKRDRSRSLSLAGSEERSEP